MNALEKINSLIQDKRVISFTGSGGKTTLIKKLAKFYKEKDYSVLITTTSKMEHPNLFKYGTDYAFTNMTEILSYEVKKGESVFYAEEHIMDLKKVRSPELHILEILIKRFDIVLIEADDALSTPLKIHTEKDPNIPSFSTFNISMMGLSSLGMWSEDALRGWETSEKVDVNFIQRLIDNPEGPLKGIEKGLLLLNQADTISNEDLDKLNKLESKIQFIIVSLKDNHFYNS